MDNLSYPTVSKASDRAHVAATLAVAAATLLPSCDGDKIKATRTSFELFAIAFDRLAPPQGSAESPPHQPESDQD